MLALQLLQSPDLAGAWSSRSAPSRFGGLRSQAPFPKLLPPARQHERVDVEGLGDGFHLNAWSVTQLHGRALELDPVLLRLLRARSAHLTPPIVRWKCLLYRGKIPRRLQAAVRQHYRFLICRHNVECQLLLRSQR